MKAIMIGNLMDGFEIVTKDDGSLWDDGDDSIFECVNTLAEKHKDGCNAVMIVNAYSFQDYIDTAPLVEGVDY